MAIIVLIPNENYTSNYPFDFLTKMFVENIMLNLSKPYQYWITGPCNPLQVRKVYCKGAAQCNSRQSNAWFSSVTMYGEYNSCYDCFF